MVPHLILLTHYRGLIKLCVFSYGFEVLIFRMWSAHGPYVVTFAPLCQTFGSFCPHLQDVGATYPRCARHMSRMCAPHPVSAPKTGEICAHHIRQMCAPHVQDVRTTCPGCAHHIPFPNVRPTCTTCAPHIRASPGAQILKVPLAGSSSAA